MHCVCPNDWDVEAQPSTTVSLNCTFQSPMLNSFQSVHMACSWTASRLDSRHTFHYVQKWKTDAASQDAYFTYAYNRVLHSDISANLNHTSIARYLLASINLEKTQHSTCCIRVSYDNSINSLAWTDNERQKAGNNSAKEVKENVK